MTHEEILAKAIDRAVKNGLISHGVSGEEYVHIMGKQEPVIAESLIFSIIHAHDFAKAFWGEKSVLEWEECPHCKYPGYTKECSWQYHLQQMVLSEDPIKYLERFL